MAYFSRALRPVARRHLFAPLTRRAFLSSKSGASSPGPTDPQSEAELQVGELQGAKFRIEPLRRVGEDAKTTRARLLYQSRKRGTLESDLLLSTFADAHLPTMSVELMSEYDRFLDENDWDIYYWVTQEESQEQQPRDLDTATFASGEAYRGVPPGSRKTVDAGASDPPVGQDIPVRPRPEGEWAQTVGTFKPAYRPVPSRWRDSEILRLLREHVRSRRADPSSGKAGGQTGEGMAFMPPLFDVQSTGKS
ncbi:DUF339-domain-containing protein [Sodiomyces alkalinus F11]|uniref:Succinate dehydrogenase assembly factor 2, mitochondrial n=1 Tax=Sodiomyces alkalinus (strain CBS 110278 / VKM F-3762 / F11) TaxID=1314773 RepID=A0A3N2PT32_SODAK|nr:DUF339-domain-containing protein [Sodiomyces alkalinus F11]ROT37682.1 DUF339-domain-containing protein [Sodiomyces alkalinus F11]